MKKLILALSLLISFSAFAENKIDLTTQVKNVLPVANGGINQGAVAITGGTINGVTGTNSGMTVGTATNATNANTSNGVNGFTHANTISFDWYSAYLSLKIDSTNFGATWPINISGTANNAIGVGQSYQNYTGTHIANTTYTNSTGRTIFVAATFGANAAAIAYLIVNGNNTQEIQGPTGGIIAVLSAPIPDGATFEFYTGSGVTLNAVWELR